MIVSAPTYSICPTGRYNLCIIGNPEEIKNPFDPNKKLIEIQFEAKSVDGQKFTVSLRCSPVLHPKGHLLPLVEAILGRQLTIQEQLRFDLDSINGCVVSGEVTHQASTRGNVYPKVGNFKKAAS